MKAKSLVYLLTFLMLTAGVPVASLASGNSPANSQPVEQQSGDTSQAAQNLKQARALMKRGRSDQALGLLDNALKQFTQANSPRGIAATNDAFGDLYMRQGQYAVALKHYQNAHDAFKAAVQGQGAVENAVGMPDNEYNADLMLAKIGDANFRMGKTSEAGAAYAQIDVAKPNPTSLATGNSTTAPPKKKRGLLGGVSSVVSSVPGAGGASGAVGTGAAVLQTVQAAVALYRQTILYSLREVGQGRVDYSNNQLDSSKKHFTDALDTASMAIIGKFGQSRRVRAAARTSLGDIAVRQNNPRDAIKFYTDAVKGATEDHRLDLMWPAQRGLGRAKWLQAAQESNQTKAMQAREGALASYREALQTVETIRSGSLRADEARTTFLASIKDVYDEAASAMAEMALMSAPASGGILSGKALDYAAESFKVVEQGRARSLLDLLGETGTNITEGVPPELLKRKQDNLDRQQEIEQLLTGVSATEGEKPDVSKLEAELETLSTEYDQIENQIRAASPRYAALTAPQPLSLSEVQQQVLDDRTALLEYSLGDERSFLWVATQSGVSLFRMPARNAVNQQAQDFRAQLIPPRLQRRIVGIDVAANQTRGLGLSSTPPASGADASAFVAASNALYKTAVEPAASTFGDRRLLVVADGALNYIPFEALVTAGGGTDYSTLPYLIKTNEVVYAPSASVIAVVRKQSSRPTGRDVLLVADPVFNSLDPRASGAAAVSSPVADTRGLGLQSALTDVAGDQANAASSNTQMKGLPLARLNGTHDEALQISRLVTTAGGRAEVWEGLKASEDNVESQSIKQYRVVHIATHGLLDAERPQFTGVVLSLIGNRNSDGFLRTDEIFNLRLGSPLVMLSACETGLGRERRGEGVIGLTRAFMYAGAPTVGVSLWSVADQSTALLMTGFYKRLLTGQGESASSAMRAAQLEMIQNKRYSAPFYWAPFILVGEWR